MVTREEAQQVLDALVNSSGVNVGDERRRVETVETLRARLSAPEPEPVAWRKKWENENKWEYYEFDRYRGSEPLYAVQPQREWQGLTDEDRQELAAEQYGWEGLCSAVEAKLREKNT